MRPNLILAAALSLGLAAPAFAADLRYVDADIDALGLVDAASISKTGDRAKAGLTLILRQPVQGAHAFTMVLEFDCKARTYRHDRLITFDAELTRTSESPQDSDWEDVGPTSRFEMVRAMACDGKALPPAGSGDLATLRRDYLATPDEDLSSGE